MGCKRILKRVESQQMTYRRPNFTLIVPIVLIGLVCIVLLGLIDFRGGNEPSSTGFDRATRFDRALSSL
jgi:hypothetical protein